jgi:DNA-binding LacI/PurR family transcriptional regulator
MRMSSHNTHRPTLRDVAREADVSVWTASTTFSNPDRVAGATRQRVIEAADALGYVGPNPGARTLALGRSYLVAFATDSEPEHLLSDPAAAVIAQGALTACSRAGLSVVFTSEREAPLVEGTISFRTSPRQTRRPLVQIADAALEGVPTVRPDLDSGMAMLAEYLMDCGHRRAVILSAPGDDARLAAFGRHFTGAGDLQVLRTSGESPWPTRGAGEVAALRALRISPRPSLLVAMNDVLAAGALDAAHAMGIDVPGELSIVGVDDTPGSDALGLTTVVVPYRPMGELAAAVLIRRIEGDLAFTTPPPLTTTLAIRRSAGPAAPA